MEKTITDFYNLHPSTPVNLVLSGGGMKGVAHLPLLEYIEERGIKINSISGASVGALVAALYASGISTSEIRQIFTEIPLFKYTWIKAGIGGVFDSNRYVDFFRSKLKEDFNDLNIPIHVCATNITVGKPEYFNSGNLLETVVASCALPGMFSTVTIDDMVYSDGGIMDNFPILPFADSEYPIIGSFLGKPKVLNNQKWSNPLSVLERSFFLQKYAMELHKMEQTFYTFSHDLNSYSMFKRKSLEDIYQYARETVYSGVQGMEEIQQKIG